jgi:hypothetical protein
MQITESQLRNQIRTLLKEFHSTNFNLLAEGPELDRAELIKKFPDKSVDISGLPPKWIIWLNDRFGVAPKREETHPFSDALPTVKLFSTKEAAITQKWKSNEQFKKSVFDDELFSDTGESFSPADPTKLTVDQLERLLALSERKKQRFDIDAGSSSVETDRVGKVGRWNIWMPTTRENSCKIAGYDPVTMKEKTTWCTARMSGSNLFYNYIGRQGSEITLFYIIADDPKLDSDWLSVGFVNGRPELKGQNGGLSVDRSNKGLTDKSLITILGSDHKQIMQMMVRKNESLGGRHPSRSKVEAAAQSVNALQDLIRGLSEEEEEDLLFVVLDEDKISKEVFTQLVNHKNAKISQRAVENEDIPAELLAQLGSHESVNVRRSIARHTKTPAETLIQLSKDKNQFVRQQVAQNKNVPNEVFVQFAKDESEEIRSIVAKNPSTPVEILAQFAEDESANVRGIVAQKENVPPEILTKLAKDTSKIVRQQVARNENVPAKALSWLARDTTEWIRDAAASNPNTPQETLTQLAKDADDDVRMSVALNPNASVEAFDQLAKDKFEMVRKQTARNKNTPPEILTKLAKDVSLAVQQSVAENERTPQIILAQFAKNTSNYIRASVASNKSAPVEILDLLSKDESGYVRMSVISNPSTAIDTLKRLATSEDVYMRDNALEALENRQQLNELKRLISYLI